MTIQMICAYNAPINGGYLLTPHVVDKIVDAGVMPGNRPEDRGRGQALFFGPVEDRFALDEAAFVLPKAALFAHDSAFIIDDTVFVRIDTGLHRGVTGIGDGRID